MNTFQTDNRIAHWVVLLIQSSTVQSYTTVPLQLIQCVVIQGVVYFDSAVLGWRPVVGRWLSGRDKRESQCMLKDFEQIMDSVVEFVLIKSG